jgi:hypothetical protein
MEGLAMKSKFFAGFLVLLFVTFIGVLMYYVDIHTPRRNATKEMLNQAMENHRQELQDRLIRESLETREAIREDVAPTSEAELEELRKKNALKSARFSLKMLDASFPSSNYELLVKNLHESLEQAGANLADLGTTQEHVDTAVRRHAKYAAEEILTALRHGVIDHDTGVSELRHHLRQGDLKLEELGTTRSSTQPATQPTN